MMEWKDQLIKQSAHIHVKEAQESSGEMSCMQMSPPRLDILCNKTTRMSEKSL